MNTRNASPRLHVVVSTLMLLFVAIGTGEQAAAQQAADEADVWQIAVTPYLWATRMKGDVKAGPLPNASLDMKFSDILDTLDFGFMTAVEARKDRWGILFDGMFMKVSDSATMSNDDIGLAVNGDLTIKQSMLAGALAYRVITSRIPVDVIGGARYNRIDADGTVDARLIGLGSGTVDLSGTKDWIDPYIGLRAIAPLNDKWSVVGYVDVGGFGAGSDFTWQGLVGVEYAFSKSLCAIFGYRYMKIDYDKDDFKYDVANDGFYAGATIHF